MAALCYRRIGQRPFSEVDAVLLLGLVAPLAYVYWVKRTSRIHRRIQLASVYNKPLKMLQLIRKMERASTGMSEVSRRVLLESSEAKALAKLGRLDEAIALIKGLYNRGDLSERGLHSHRGIIYQTAGDFETSARCHRDLSEISPDDATVWIARAGTLAVHLRRPNEARLALNRCAGLAMTARAAAFMRVAQATIALEKRRAHEAREAIGEALPRLNWRARRTPIAKGSVAIARALHSIACTQRGDHAAARRALRRSTPILSRNASTRELFEHTRHAVGQC